MPARRPSAVRAGVHLCAVLLGLTTFCAYGATSSGRDSGPEQAADQLLGVHGTGMSAGAFNALRVSHPATAPPGVQVGFGVTVTDSANTPVSGATVCLCQWAPAGDSLLLLEVDTTDGGGIAVFDITPGQTGNIVVTVTKHNYLPYKGYCHVGLFTGDSLATAYNQQRNLARVIGCDTMHLVFTDSGYVMHSVSADGGRSWQQAEAIEQGSFPTICLNYYSGDSTRRAQPWVVYKQGDDIKAALLQPGQPGNVLTIFDGHSPESVPGAPAATEYRPYSTEPQAWVTYAVTYTDGVGNHTYRIYCGRFSAQNVYPPDTLTPRDKYEHSRPSIAVTPGDTVHVVWQTRVAPETTRVKYSQYAGAGWSAPVVVPRQQDQSHSPFTETYGDSVFAAWAHPDTQAVVYKAARWLGSEPWDWTDPRPVSDSAAGLHNDFPVLATDTAAVWQRDSSGSRAVFLRIGDATPVRLSDTVYDATYPSAEARIDSLGAVTLWSAWTQELGTGQYEVVTTRYETEPTDAPSRAGPVYYSIRTGDSLPSPYTRLRDGAVRLGPYALDYARDSLSYLLPFLDPVYDYYVRALLYQQSRAKWRQGIRLGDSLRVLDFSPGKPETVWTKIPAGAYRRDAEADLAALRVAGDYSVMTEFSVYQREVNRDARKDPASGLGPDVPLRAELFRPMPNPFVRTALLRYSLSRPARVSIKVYDRAGRLVRAILEGECQPGVHVARWDGTDARGRRVANGVYFARLRTGNLAKVRKLVLSR